MNGRTPHDRRRADLELLRKYQRGEVDLFSHELEALLKRLQHGRTAYTIYQRAMREQGVDVDPWEDLDEEDEVAWDAVAKELSDEETAS